MVTAVSGVVAMAHHRAASLLSRIEFDSLRSDAVSKVTSINLLARRCLPLGHPLAASGTCTVAQISPSKQQSGERQISLKVALYAHLLENFKLNFEHKQFYV